MQHGAPVTATSASEARAHAPAFVVRMAGAFVLAIAITAISYLYVFETFPTSSFDATLPCTMDAVNNRFLAAALDFRTNNGTPRATARQQPWRQRLEPAGVEDKDAKTTSAANLGDMRALVDIVIPLAADNAVAVLEAWRDVIAGYHCILVLQSNVQTPPSIPGWIDYELHAQSTLLQSIAPGDVATFLPLVQGSRALGALLSSKRFVFALDPQTLPSKGVNVVAEHVNNLATKATPFYFDTYDDTFAQANDLRQDSPWTLERHQVAMALSQGAVRGQTDLGASTPRSKPSSGVPAEQSSGVHTVSAGTYFSMSSLNLAFARDLLGPVPLLSCGECPTEQGGLILGWAAKTITDHLQLGVKSSSRPCVILPANVSSSSSSSSRGIETAVARELESVLAFFNTVQLSARTVDGSVLELAAQLREHRFSMKEPHWIASAMEATVATWKLWQKQRPRPLRIGKAIEVTTPVTAMCDGIHDANGNVCHIAYVTNSSNGTTFNGMTTLQERNDFYDKNVYRCGMTGPPQHGLMPQPHRRGIVLFTTLTNCYDPLPRVQHAHLAAHRIAFVDNRTAQALERIKDSGAPPWEYFILDPWPEYIWTPAFGAEVYKSLAARLFPNAEWIVYADGKAKFDLAYFLSFATRSAKTVFTAQHVDRASPAKEFKRTRGLLLGRRASQRQIDALNYHEQVYRNEGFFDETFWLNVPEIMVVMVKPSDKNAQRFMCAWFNEIAFLSMRGQLSFLYPLLRLNLLSIYAPFPIGAVKNVGHQPIC